ncbi:hypothetical protein [Nocardia sputorum]|uniref:Tat pathway signal protein n=1 Tax=Nocardia sputorum TaxID=2984338 RepID=A0ABN6U299_9NOCA|nr:hypothetical protein [Nocardia sputorum]BDT90104.1 hypothetical protein IFM12275_00800 [Nocardia sputorum]BDT98729.1 hypothetical protein IFM12276_17580 [Nocardia sputorum]
MTFRTSGRTVRGYLRVAALFLCLVFAAGAVSTARAEPAYAAYLDLPSVNGDGAGAGGLDPALPLDESGLAEALRQARADGVAPRRYATLLHQYWLVVATRNADIDLAAWDPGRGPHANERIFNQVYVNYLRLATRHPEFYWAGLAGIAGGSFASGFFDMGDVGVVLDVPGIHQFGEAVADLLRATPPELARALPEDIRLLATEGSRLSAADVAWYQTRLMIMQKHIFTDLVPMHEAYVALGMRGIEEMYAAGLLDDDLRTAWRSIASGTRDGYVDALIRMTDREQNRVVADQWDETSAGRAPIGRVLTYVSTVAGKPGVPGVRAPGVFAPTVVSADVGGRSLALRVPLPGFNWADRDTRWNYITGDLVPRHIDLETDPALAGAVLGEAFLGKLARGRLAARLPDLLADLTAHWQISG